MSTKKEARRRSWNAVNSAAPDCQLQCSASVPWISAVRRRPTKFPTRTRVKFSTRCSTAGINFIDTAICYGTSEARIGQAISHRRNEFVLATKCGCQPGMPMAAPNIHTAANIRAGVEHSLRTMRTDYLDIVQFHQSLNRETWESEGALDELLKMKAEGKLRFIGVSGIFPDLIGQVNSGLFDVFQIPYSAIQREHESIIAKASKDGAGIIIRGAVARGAPMNWNKRYYMMSGEEMNGRGIGRSSTICSMG